MKLSDYLRDVGRPVSYYPSMAHALGGVKQAVFLCQLIYWSDKGHDTDGWIYKSVDELKKETGMSYEEQRAARAALSKSGVLEELHKRLEHRLYFRVNFDALNQVWDDFTKTPALTPDETAACHQIWEAVLQGNSGPFLDAAPRIRGFVSEARQQMLTDGKNPTSHNPFDSESAARQPRSFGDATT